MSRSPSIAIVGAGPRGTSVLERICASIPEILVGSPLHIHVVDAYPPGAGRVWRTSKPRELLMNTISSQVTLFTDDSVTCEGPIVPGPSVYEWARARGDDIGPDQYPTRARYGEYLSWVFAHVVACAPDSIKITVHQAVALGLSPSNRLTLNNGIVLDRLTAVVLAQGHVGRQDTPAEARFGEHDAFYLPPSNPSDYHVLNTINRLAPGTRLFLRGLGLCFFDYMSLFTEGRGGAFQQVDGTLRYIPSGKELQLYAGCRRGVPHHARGDNEKRHNDRHIARVLTPDIVASLRDTSPLDFESDVWPLVAKEVESVYYEALVVDEKNKESFVESFIAASDTNDVLNRFGISDRFDWQRIQHPIPASALDSPVAFSTWLRSFLVQDIAEATLGNVSSPLKAALDVMRDVRNEIRSIVDHRGLDPEGRAVFDSWYTPLNAFLSIGPPRSRVEEMVALIDAGVLSIIGPEQVITMVPSGFEVASALIPSSAVTVQALIEARLPEPDIRHTSDELLASLFEAGDVRAHVIKAEAPPRPSSVQRKIAKLPLAGTTLRRGSWSAPPSTRASSSRASSLDWTELSTPDTATSEYITGGVDVTAEPFHLVDASGRPHPNRFALGVPLEGVHWATAAGARPGVDSVTLGNADAVARAVLRCVRAAC